MPVKNSIFMVCFNINVIKKTTKIQVDTFIFILFCFIFCVYAMIFILMVIVKEIIFTCTIYSVTVCGTDCKS